MRKFIPLLYFVFLLPIAIAQETQNGEEVVHFRKLQECLPTYTPEGFIREEPTGSTGTLLGIAASEAIVQYSKSVSDEDIELPTRIEVKISDNVFIPLTEIGMKFISDYENETEDGYEKTTTIQGYRAIETVDDYDIPYCKLAILVENRFFVEVEGYYMIDIPMLKKIAESINFKKLKELKENR